MPGSGVFDGKAGGQQFIVQGLFLCTLQCQSEVLGVGVGEVDGMDDIPHLTESGSSAFRPFESCLRATDSASPVTVVVGRRV